MQSKNSGEQIYTCHPMDKHLIGFDQESSAGTAVK
jgi:hypothetical protein